ncbi:uncharacterized protein DS421_12g360870 [Arachis hypogaea]|nr:uncharacterized protein DS421_12g360870 [Arachis hypogaea]
MLPLRRMKRLEVEEVVTTLATPRQRRVATREACVRGWVMLCDELEVSEVAEEEHGDDGVGVENEGFECDGEGHKKKEFECNGEGGI